LKDARRRRRQTFFGCGFLTFNGYRFAFWLLSLKCWQRGSAKVFAMINRELSLGMNKK